MVYYQHTIAHISSLNPMDRRSNLLTLKRARLEPREEIEDS